MTSEDFQQLRSSFDRLLAAGKARRAELLQSFAKDNAGLARELERMLAAHDSAPGFLDDSVDVDGRAHEQTTTLPAQIGAYRIERELGRGGMGVVYQGSRADGVFNKRVAIKVLPHDRADRLFLSRFHQERRILARLNHPHIASMLDAGVTPEGDPYFVMEYVDGEPLITYSEKRSLGLEQKLDLFLQVCDALQHAHRNLTVHRDLKPGNILVTEAGAVKLLDFGIAKLMDGAEPEEGESAGSDAPQTAAILTPEYASPEQIRREPVATSADVFAMGILLYELISGSHPFRAPGRPPHQVMRAICDDDPPPPSAVAIRHARQIRGELDAIVMTALRKQPEWRYPSVDQIADDITRFRRGWPVLARGNSVAYRLGKFVRRQWLPLSATTLLFIILTAGILATMREARVAEAARAQAEEQRAAAERQQSLAEQARRSAELARADAVEQRGIAEARTAEAVKERQKEQERYREVRALADSLLFDVYDGVRDLAGSSTARRVIVEKAQHQLELLNSETGRDAGLERDLASSYERMGELRVDPRNPNKNDAAAAVDSYRRAVDLRKKIAARHPADSGDQRDLSLSMTKLGDGLFLAGNSKNAIASYTRARDMARGISNTAADKNSEPRALGAADERLCTTLPAASAAAANEACQEAIATLAPLAATLPNDVGIQRLLAVSQASYANALRLGGKPRQAAAEARTALDLFHRLEAQAPSNAEYRRLSSSAETILAGSLASTGDITGSLEAYNRSIRAMEIAIEIDPADLHSPLRLAGTLLALSRRLSAGPEKERAHDAAREALRLLEQTSGKPGAGAVEWNEYADALLKVDWPDLQNPAKALPLAQNAADATRRENPFILDTLAWAYFKTGDAPHAVETERAALKLLPAKATGGLHDELTQGLNTFLSGPSH